MYKGTMKACLILSLVYLLALTSLLALANPAPFRGGPSGLPPHNPRATIKYAKNGGTVHLAIDGDHNSVAKQCRGLEGTLALELVDSHTRYPNESRRAYSLLLFHEWGCKVVNGKMPVEVAYFDGHGSDVLKDAQGNVVIPKSVKLIPCIEPLMDSTLCRG
ncbi:hypothetical protein BCR44DRAFT_90531 [Catenaria anguillulae PL171]|uniref:Uncharacterized protein n=1 Tax=Catenaria anguillulae PL171 TaxID=765915 RepID=A0A1Y2HMQ3_9FUNG|nr:hypothetical protein BCR44DRAFT_90531 [Catenaria anguillulae PL171]